MKSLDELVELHGVRTKASQVPFAAIQKFRDYLGNKLAVALPEVDADEDSAIANIARTGLKQLALRTGSTLPEVMFPPLRPGIQLSEDRARNRKQATLKWWQHNDMQALLTKRAQYLFADAYSPVTVLPDPKTGYPTWQARDTLTCLHAPIIAPGVVPYDAIFNHQHTWASLKRLYGSRVEGMNPRNDPDRRFTVAEYIDPDEIVTFVAPDGYNNQSRPLILDRIPNKAGCPLVFIAGIDSILGWDGDLNATVGAHQMRAKLLALAYITVKRGAIPDVWVEPIDNSSTPDFTAIPNHRTGTPGVIKGGRLKVLESNPGFMTSPMMSILEREERLTAGLPAEFGGEAATGIRTARRGDQVSGAAIDFPIQQAQNALASSLTMENKAAIEIAKKWTPGKRSFYVSWKGAMGFVEYDPNVDFETDEHVVRYPFAGSDLNDATVRHAQLVGTGQMSKQTARRMNPELEDGDQEGDLIAAEQVRDAFWASVAAKVNDPASRYGPKEVAMLDKLLRTDKKDLFAAVEAVEKSLAAQQEMAAPAPDALPGVMGAPMAEPEATIPPVGEGLANLAAQLRAQRPVNAAAAGRVG